jgi:hypothetical protein
MVKIGRLNAAQVLPSRRCVSAGFIPYRGVVRASRAQGAFESGIIAALEVECDDADEDVRHVKVQAVSRPAATSQSKE